MNAKDAIRPAALGQQGASVPASWPSGALQTVKLGPFIPEFGGHLDSVTVAFETYGTFTGDNAVLIEHALTGDAHVAGPAGPGQPTQGWWSEVVRPGGDLDTDKWFVVCANALGGCRGTTGPASRAEDGKAWGSRWPRITIRDQVRIEALLADHLGISRFAAVIGGSMGGMRAIEWLIMYPERVCAALLLATTAVSTADQIGIQTAQITAITNDPQWQGGDYYGTGHRPTAGLALARKIAHLTYRSEAELDERFGRNAQHGEQPLGPDVPGRHEEAGRFAVQSYLDYHGNKLVRRFDAGSYISLTDSMNTHDVTRGRGSLAEVLGRITAPVVVAGIESDRLYPIYQQQQLAELIPTAEPLQVVDSPYGHDGFLIEFDQVGALVKRTLELSK